MSLNANPNDTTLNGPSRPFPQTRWSLILELADPATPGYVENLEHLIGLYWKPVYCFIRHAWKRSNEEAKDLTQSYFLALMEQRALQQVSREKGRFRSFLKASLKNFLMRIQRDQARLKRGGRKMSFSIDVSELADRLEDEQAGRPEDAFDREWMETLIQSALKICEDEMRSSGKAIRFQIFKRFHFPERNRPSYQELANTLKLPEFDIGNHLKAARKRYKEAVLTLIGEYVTSEEERDREFLELFGEGA